MQDETHSVEWPCLGCLGVAGILQLQREGVGRRGEAVARRGLSLVAHPQVVLKQSHALAGVVSEHLVEAFSEERRFLRRPVERRQQDGLAAAGLAKHGEVLFLHLRCHAGESTTGDPWAVAGLLQAVAEPGVLGRNLAIAFSASEQPC